MQHRMAATDTTGDWRRLLTETGSNRDRGAAAAAAIVVVLVSTGAPFLLLALGVAIAVAVIAWWRSRGPIPWRRVTGVANAIVRAALFERYRLVINEEPNLRITGRLQQRDGVVHVQAETITRLELDELPAQASHDFH